MADVFSNEGIGTLVYANEYTQIRRALKKDVRTLIALTKNSMAAAELVKRTRAAMEKQITTRIATGISVSAQPVRGVQPVRGREDDDDRRVIGFGNDVPAFLMRAPPRLPKTPTDD